MNNKIEELLKCKGITIQNAIPNIMITLDVSFEDINEEHNKNGIEYEVRMGKDEIRLCVRNKRFVII